MGQGQGLFSIHDESVGDAELLVAFEQSHDIPCPPGHSGAAGTNWGLGEAVTTQEVLKDPDGEEGRAQGTSGGNPWGLGICSCCPLRHHLCHHGKWARNRGRWRWGSSNQALAGQRRMNRDVYSEPCMQSPEPKSWPGPQSPPGPTLPDSAGDQG